MAENETLEGNTEKSAASKLIETSGDGFVMLRTSVNRALVKSRTSVSRFREKSKSLAGPALTRTAITLKLTGNRGATGLKSFYANRLKPVLRGAGSKLLRQLHPASLVREYRHLQLFIHRWGPDRRVERLCFVPTRKHVPLSVVRVPHQLRRSGHDYRPTPRLVFKWAMEALPEPVDRFAFVDYGAGRGRVLLMASHYPFEKIIGAEVAEELHRDCMLNIAQYPRSLMKCRNIDCEHMSALRLDIPNQDTVFFFHNPFNDEMMARVMDQVVKSYRQNTRRFYVICVDLHNPDTILDTGVFEPVRLPWRLRTRIAAYSPYRISLFRTVH